MRPVWSEPAGIPGIGLRRSNRGRVPNRLLRSPSRARSKEWHSLTENHEDKGMNGKDFLRVESHSAIHRAFGRNIDVRRTERLFLRVA